MPLTKDCIPIKEIPNACQNLGDNYDNVYSFLNTLPKDKGGQPTYMVSGALNKKNITTRLKTVFNWFNTIKIDDVPFWCSGNGVLGGASETMDLSGTETSVAPALRNSVMAITCATGWQITDNIEIQHRRMRILDQLADTELKALSTDQFVYWNEPQHNFEASDWKARYWGGMDRYNQFTTS